MGEYKEIQKAITVYVPGNLCNLRCSYCYVTECLMENHEEKPKFLYSVEHMIEAFRPERIGGIAYLTVIGGGETLIPPEVVPFVKGLLHHGHVVELVTNNTLDNRIDELLDTPKEDLARLIVKCSLHWNELVRLNKVDSYFANIRKIVAAGASSFPFLVICDEYMSKLDEICETCEREIGALPHCTPCVTSEKKEDFLRGGTAVTQPPCTPEFVQLIDEKLHSRLFKESVRFLEIDPQKVFCYAGKYAFVVRMGDGMVAKCHDICTDQCFFEHIDKPFTCDYVGCECGVATCGLQYQYFGTGMIPEVPGVPTYSEMICNREGLFQEEVRRLMDVKICKGDRILTEAQRIEYLMDKVCEKNCEIEEMKRKIANRNGGILNDEMVQTLLTKVDENKLSYNELQDITYEYLCEVYRVCCTMEQGENLFLSILEKIYKGLLDSHVYESIDNVYVASGRIQKTPITDMVVCDKLYDAMQICLAEKNYKDLAKLYFTQIKWW